MNNAKEPEKTKSYSLPPAYYCLYCKYQVVPFVLHAEMLYLSLPTHKVNTPAAGITHRCQSALLVTHTYEQGARGDMKSQAYLSK